MQNRDLENLRKKIWSPDLSKEFESIQEAARYLIDNNYSRTKSIESVRIYLSRAINKGWKVYGLRWYCAD